MSPLRKPITLAVLRKDCPGWVFTSLRNGLGWVYRGFRGEERIDVYAASRITGDWEEGKETEWRVKSGGRDDPYYLWLLRNHAKL